MGGRSFRGVRSCVFGGRVIDRQQVRRAGLPVASVLLALAIGAVLIALQGHNPGKAALAVWNGAFNGRSAIGRTLEKATPLVLAGIAVIVALKAGLFNIGAQGQLVFGALMSGYVGYRIGLPTVLHVPLGLLVGALFGALTAAIAGFLKATRSVHEVISTIMLNTIISNLTEYLAGGPWRQKGQAISRTAEIRPSAKIGHVFGLPLGFAIAVAAAFLVWFLISRTTFGFRLTTVGANRHAAHYAGISVARITVMAMAISGALAGLGGAIETQGIVNRFEPGFNASLGFDGITIALLARVSPRAAIPGALLIGALRASNTKLQADAGLAPEIVDAILGIILLLVAAPIIVRWVLRMRHDEAGEQLQLTSGWGS